METDIVTNLPTSSHLPESSHNLWKYLIIFLILALLGFNILTYFGQLTHMLGSLVDSILNLVRPVFAYFGYGLGEVTKKTINVTADTLTGGISVLEKGLKKPSRGKKPFALNKKIKPPKHPQPDASGSLSPGKGARKAGFCYIGEDRGFRSCIAVGEGDYCMSQDIYPTREQCINPSLRSG